MGEKRFKKSKRAYRTSQKIRIINVFLESLLSESFAALGTTVHLISLGCPPTLCWSLDLRWGLLLLLLLSRFSHDPIDGSRQGSPSMGFPRQEYWGGLPLPSPAVGAAQILIWSQSCLFLRQCPQLSELMCFLLWELSVAFYVFHRYRVWLVDHVDSVCSVYSSWEGLGSSSLATLPLGFTCGFMSASACGSSTGVCSWGCPGWLGFAPVRARWGGGAAAWVAGLLAAPGTQGGLAARAAGNTVL